MVSNISAVNWVVKAFVEATPISGTGNTSGPAPQPSTPGPSDTRPTTSGPAEDPLAAHLNGAKGCAVSTAPNFVAFLFSLLLLSALWRRKNP